jgi:hypothetical protein
MNQVPLERLLAGIAAALKETVAPAVADPYARTQALTAANLIENIATRVQWREDLLRAELERLEPLLDDAERLAGRSIRDRIAALRADASAELPVRRVAALAALAVVQEWLADAGEDADPALASGVSAFLAWQLEDQSSRLRS